MQANDLRIRNLIQYHESYVYVESISSGVMVGIKSSGVTYNVILSDCKPIPLSPEILEKAGFVNNGRYSFIDVHHTLSISVNNSTGEVYLTHVDENESEADVPLPHIKHLHQISNLYYSLVGTELNINL